MIQRWSLIAYALRKHADGEWVRWEDVREAIEALAELGAAALAYDKEIMFDRATASTTARYSRARDEALSIAEYMAARAVGDGDAGEGHA